MTAILRLDRWKERWLPFSATLLGGMLLWFVLALPLRYLAKSLADVAVARYGLSLILVSLQAVLEAGLLGFFALRLGLRQGMSPGSVAKAAFGMGILNLARGLLFLAPFAVLTFLSERNAPTGLSVALAGLLGVGAFYLYCRSVLAAGYICANEESIVDAVTHSFASTGGRFWQTLGRVLVLFVVGLSGGLLLCLGVCVTGSLALVSYLSWCEDWRASG